LLAADADAAAAFADPCAFGTVTVADAAEPDTDEEDADPAAAASVAALHGDDGGREGHELASSVPPCALSPCLWIGSRAHVLNASGRSSPRCLR